MNYAKQNNELIGNSQGFDIWRRKTEETQVEGHNKKGCKERKWQTEQKKRRAQEQNKLWTRKVEKHSWAGSRRWSKKETKDRGGEDQEKNCVIKEEKDVTLKEGKLSAFQLSKVREKKGWGSVNEGTCQREDETQKDSDLHKTVPPERRDGAFA